MRTLVQTYKMKGNHCSGVEVQEDKSKKGKKMKTLCILLFFGATLIKAHENDFEVVVKNDSILERYTYMKGSMN